MFTILKSIARLLDDNLNNILWG